MAFLMIPATLALAPVGELAKPGPIVSIRRRVYYDDDGDGFGDPAVSYMAGLKIPEHYVANDDDCDDANAAVNPGAVDVDLDWIDNNCDGTMHEHLCVTFDSLSGQFVDLWIFNRTTWTGKWDSTSEPAVADTLMCTPLDLKEGDVYQINGRYGTSPDALTGWLVGANGATSIVQVAAGRYRQSCEWVDNREGGGDLWCTLVFSPDDLVTNF